MSPWERMNLIPERKVHSDTSKHKVNLIPQVVGEILSSLLLEGTKEIKDCKKDGFLVFQPPTPHSVLFSSAERCGAWTVAQKTMVFQWFSMFL